MKTPQAFNFNYTQTNTHTKFTISKVKFYLNKNSLL